MTLDDDFPARLSRCRAEQGFSQQDLAELTGIAPAQLSRYESGKSKPRPAIVARISDALGVSMLWLSTGQIPLTHETTTFPLGLPDDLKLRLEEAAKASGRHLNGEILFRLEMSFALSSSGAIDPSREAELTQKIIAEYDERMRKTLSEIQTNFENLLDRASRNKP